MPDKPSRLGLTCGLIGLLGAVFVLADDCASLAAAAPQDEGHALAMLYVHEANFEGWADYPALYWAVTFRARSLRRTRMRQMRLYATSMWYPRTARQRWVAALPREGGRVPSNVDPEEWWTILELARGHVEDPPANPCDGRVEHWGSPTHPVDSGRARRAVATGRWRQLNCGETLNEFYAVLRRSGP